MLQLPVDKAAWMLEVGVQQSTFSSPLSVSLCLFLSVSLLLLLCIYDKMEPLILKRRCICAMSCSGVAYKPACLIPSVLAKVRKRQESPEDKSLRLHVPHTSSSDSKQLKLACLATVPLRAPLLESKNVRGRLLLMVTVVRMQESNCGDDDGGEAKIDEDDFVQTSLFLDIRHLMQARMVCFNLTAAGRKHHC